MTAYPALASGPGPTPSELATEHKVERRPAASGDPEVPPGCAYAFRPGDVLGGRYVTVKPLGSGVYGSVVECVDMVTKLACAVKLTHARKTYFRQAQSEIAILKQLGGSVSSSSSPVSTSSPSSPSSSSLRKDAYAIRFRDTFVHGGHQCLVFDLMGDDLHRVLCTSEAGALPIATVRAILERLLIFLAALSARCPAILHCDLKPENVVLTPDREDIVVVDFGGACHADRTPGFYVQSRYYRAPEVLLAACNYGPPIDMWSLGCIAIELATGEVAFRSHCALHQLHLFQSLLGPPPLSFLARCVQAKSHYISTTDSKGNACATPVALPHALRAARKPLTADALPGPPEFKDLVARMLRYDPYERITPRQALQHPFISRTV